MAEVINSLFGVTPESLIADRESRLQAQAMKYAELDPFQRATAGIYAGANKLGGAIGGMLGAQDPEMQRLTQRQTLLQQAQPQDAAGWKGLAQQLWKSGDTQGAQEALAKSQALESTALAAEKTRSEIAKNTAPKVTPSSVSERNRSIISQAEVKLANKQELSPQELATVRWLTSQETTAKIYPDKDTGELIRVEPLNLSEAAPNIAKLLGKGTTPSVSAPADEGSMPTQVAAAPVTQLAPGITSISTPSSKAREGIKNEKVQSTIEGIDQSIKLVGDIENTLSSGGLTTNPLLYNITSGIGGTDAKTIATKLKGVEAQKVIATIEEMKSQSSTGATGFGALNLSELDQLKSSFLALDPSSKSFPEDLKSWKERLTVIKNKLQNKGGSTGNYSSNVEAQINAVMSAPQNKGKTREQVINSLKAKGLIQ